MCYFLSLLYLAVYCSICFISLPIVLFVNSNVLCLILLLHLTVYFSFRPILLNSNNQYFLLFCFIRFRCSICLLCYIQLLILIHLTITSISFISSIQLFTDLLASFASLSYSLFCFPPSLNLTAWSICFHHVTVR